MPKISRVKLLKKIKSNGNWILVPALFDSKGRVRRDHVMIEGRDEAHSEGSYYLEWWDGGKRYREGAGPNAFAAAEKVRVKQAELTAVRRGIIPPPITVELVPQRTTLAAALDGYKEYGAVSPDTKDIPHISSHPGIIQGILQEELC